MYRLLNCKKDAYITNVYTGVSRSFYSNTGMASTLDLFKLQDEKIFAGNTTSGTELTRLLVHFDLEPLLQLTSSILDIGHSSFKCFMRLKDVYGGQTTPSNFTVSIFPLSKSWDEGRGIDVISYRDLDAVNFITASLASGSVVLWNGEGASSSGSLGSSNIDIISSGSFGFGVVSFEKTQTFGRGDEDLYVDITNLVSGTIAGLIPNHGFRISFTGSQELDSQTRFVKRFGARHAKNNLLRPKLIVKYNESVSDDQSSLYFDIPNTIFIYNNFYGTSRHFFSGSIPITSSNSLSLKLVASRSINVLTTSYQANFSASITYPIKTIEYFSVSFDASQFAVGQNYITGAYYSTFTLSGSSDSNLISMIGPSSSIDFKSYWQSLDGTITYATGSYLKVNKILASDSNVNEKNFVVNITNLKTDYVQGEIARLRVFVQDYSPTFMPTKLPQKSKSLVQKNMYFRLLNAFSRETVIPFDVSDNSTKLSSDGNGMYFDLYTSDLDLYQVYELEFLITENGKDYYIDKKSFRFKVLP